MKLDVYLQSIHAKASPMQISSEDPHFKFIPYGLNTPTTDNTIRRIILTQNIFLSNMAIVPINSILQKDEPQVMESFKRSRNFTAIEPTRNPLKEDGC